MPAFELSNLVSEITQFVPDVCKKRLKSMSKVSCRHHKVWMRSWKCASLSPCQASETLLQPPDHGKGITFWPAY